jgi:hypothetical protein
MDVRIVVIEKEIKEKSFVKTYKVEISGFKRCRRQQPHLHTLLNLKIGICMSSVVRRASTTSSYYRDQNNNIETMINKRVK